MAGNIPNASSARAGQSLDLSNVGKPTCQHCDNFRALDAPWLGECRKSSPGRRGWPKVKGTDWCAAFRPLPSPTGGRLQ